MHACFVSLQEMCGSTPSIPPTIIRPSPTCRTVIGHCTCLHSGLPQLFTCCLRCAHVCLSACVCVRRLGSTCNTAEMPETGRHACTLSPHYVACLSGTLSKDPAPCTPTRSSSSIDHPTIFIIFTYQCFLLSLKWMST